MMSNIFNIFSIDWWMDESNNALQMTDSVLFLLLAIPVAYLFLCALFSLGKYKNPYPAAAVQHRFLVLFTVLRNGKEVIESVNRFLDTQQYPRDKYDVAIAATQLPEEDLVTLLQMPVNIVVPDKEYCTKVYAIQQVMERYAPDEYDLIVIFNSDNHIVPNALSMFNNAYYSGCDSIQAHRIAENLNTSIAVLNATSEEINNNLFRLAHTRMGFSSALIGSAMAFDFTMFHERAPKLKGSDISKAMETVLLEQNIYTEYLAEVVCYSKKEDNADGYQTQRISWIRSQYTSTFFALRYLPLVLLKGELGLCPQTFSVADAFPFPAYRTNSAMHGRCHPAELDLGSQVVRTACNAYPHLPHGTARRRSQPPSPQSHLDAPGTYVYSRIQPYKTVLL